MKTTLLKTAGLVFGIMMISTISFGQSQNRPDRPNRPSFEQLLDKMDTNADAKLSKSEVKGPLSNHFAKVDTDEDGFITKAEFENAPRPNRPDFEQVLNDFDTNKDGKISKSESKGLLQNNFAEVDTDEDGFITNAEFDNAPRPKQGNAKMGRRNSNASFARGNNRQGRPTFEQVLKNLDTDADGKISKSESKGPLQNNFAKVDTDEDGFITKAEFDNAPRPNRPDFEQVLNDLDTDKDGKLSKTEVKGPLQNYFSKVDADKDGFITKTEFDNAPRPKQKKARR